MIRLLLVFLIFFSVTNHAQSQDCADVPQVIDSADFVLKKSCSPYTIEKSLVVSEGRKLTIEDGVVVNFLTSEKYIDVRGELIVGKGVTFNMGQDTYIKTENSGKLEVNGTETDSVTFTGLNWRGLSLIKDSHLKYSKIINSSDNHNYYDWFVKLENSTIEDSRISGSQYGPRVSENSTIKNSKVHNIRRTGMELTGNSTATGNEFYDINTQENQNNHIYVHSSTFNSNRVYSISNNSNNYAVRSQGGSTIMYNTIGGSTGKHGSVGISMRYDRDHTIKYNNIGGYTSNIVIHGYKENLEFTGNTFFGEMDASSGQRNVTIVNGESDIDGYKQWGDSFNSGILSIKINLENNYWGNTSDIPSTISDYNDEIERKGIVDYDPNLSAASELAPISIPGGVTKALSGTDVILSWDKVTASDLAGYKIYSKVGEVHSLVVDITNESLTSHTVSGGDIETTYVITAYDTNADGDNDQVEGTESWYSAEFSKLSFSLSISSDDALTTVGAESNFDDLWGIENYDGDSGMYVRNYSRTTDEWSVSEQYRHPVAHIQNDCTVGCNENYYAGEVYFSNWSSNAIIEVNALVTTLETSRSSGQYYYLGQYKGHSYFRTSWNDEWFNHRDQANNDGAYLAVLNDQDELDYIDTNFGRPRGFYGYYANQAGTGNALPGKWSWVEERDPKSVFDLRFTEGSATATITASLNRTYSEDVVVTLSTSGSTTVDEDYTLSSEKITISSGSTTGTSTLTIKDDELDEEDKDIVRIEVASVTYALETVDQKLTLAIEDDDDMPGVTLTVSEDTISENGGTSNLTATLSTASGRDVTVGLVMQGTAGSKDFTVGGNEIDISEILLDSLVLNYTFSGDANDGTSNENNGTVNGATLSIDRFGEPNSAYYFDGDGDYISVPLSSSLQIEEDITLSLWLKREASDYWTDFLIRAPGEYYELRLDQRNNNTGSEAYARGAASWDHVGSGSPNIDNGEWVMLTFTSKSETDTSGYTKNKNFKIYVNGELRNSTTRTGNRYNLSTSENLMIGSNQNGDNNNFKGSMDEIRIYNKALSDEEITSLYNNSSVQKVNATISIPKGSTTGSVEVKGTDDLTDENNESILSKIISTAGASETGDQKATILVLDDDSTAVSLSATTTTINEGKDDYSTVKVTLNKASELPVTVKFKFSGVDSTDFLMKQKATLETGENVTWLPSSWGQGEPNDSGVEDYAHLVGGGYNDHQATEQRQHIMELPFPYEKDYSGYNYLADYDGHAYYRSNDNSTWEEARASTEAIDGGYLMVISTEDEYNFISNYASSEWIGFYQDRTRDDYSEPLGGWTWVNSNYNPEAGEVTIPAGSIEASVYVFAKDDAVMGEVDETMKLEIDEIINGVAGNSASIDITIVDNDIKPNVTLQGETTLNTLNEGYATDGSGKYSKLTAELSVPTTQPVTVILSATGTASTSDYVLTNDTLDITKTGLVAYYDFDGDANDNSDNSNNGTVTNAILTSDRHGNSNKAYSFDGNNSYVEIPWDGKVRVEGDITMSVWLNIKDKENNFNGGYGRIIKAPGEYYEMWVNWNNDGINNREIYGRSGGQGISITTGNNVLEETWNHVAYTYTSDTLRMYLNGNLINKQYKNWDWNNSLPGSGNIYIGAYGANSNPFLGSIDDVRLYDRALSASEISTLYSVESESPVSNSIVVSAGNTSNSVFVRPVDDDVYEATETLKLSISSVDNGQAASSGIEVNFEIDDNESVPKVSITSDKEFIGESDEFKLATITASTSQITKDTIFIVLETSGSATKDTDYELSSDSILILPGATSGTITITAKWLSENEPTEGDENIIIDVKTVTNALEDGTQRLTLDLTETSCDSVEKEIKGNIKDDLTLFELCSPYTVGKTGIRIRSGVTLTLEKNAVLTIANSGAKIQIEGKLIVKEGATINMADDSYIYTEDDGQLVIEGTASNRVTITGQSWEKNDNNGSGPGIELNSSVASTIKYADIINSNVNGWDDMIQMKDGSSIENSSISGGRYGVYVDNGSSIKDSKIFSFDQKALGVHSNSSVTGTEIYDSNLGTSNSPNVVLDGNAVFKNNRIYSTTERTSNVALRVDGSATVEYNTIGGSTGQHGAVGMSIRYNPSATIRYNNIGGYLANLALHGHGNSSQQYTFSDNTFMGTLSGNQRHVVVYDGNNRTEWHTDNISNYSDGGNGWGDEPYDKAVLEDNYWGTTNTSEIDDAIQDYEDDETFDVNGYVDFTPYNSSASTASPIQTPSGLTKALSGSDVILTWDAVSASDLAGYKIYSKDGNSYSLVQDVTDESLTSYTITGGDIENSYVITAYDTNADGTTDQNEGYESWYSNQFTKLSFSLSVSSSDGLTTVGAVSTYDTWLQAGNGGETEIYDRSVQRANDYGSPIGALENHCNTGCSSAESGMVVWDKNWGNQAYVEVNDLITTLETSRSSGQYYYLGQYNGHSYFRTSWGDGWDNHRSQSNEDGAYLVVINDDDEMKFLGTVWNNGAYVGYYQETKSGNDYTMPGVWKWVSEVEPKSEFDLRFAEGSANVTITATLDRTYSDDVVITLSTAGSATADEDYTLSSGTITVSAGSTTGTTSLTIKDDDFDEDDKDTVRIEVASATYALETVDQKILLAIEDDDDMPSVTLTASEDTISEAGGISNLTATLSTVSGRDVSVGLVMQGTAGSKDYTVGGNEIDVSEILTEGLVANYTFSGNAKDGTSNAYDGFVRGATLTADRFGEENSAYYFDGSNDFIEIPLTGVDSDLFKDEITISLWVKRKGNGTGTPRIIHNEGDSRFWIFDHDGGNRFSVRHIEEMEYRNDGPWNYNSGNWTHIAFTSKRHTSKDSVNGSFKIFVDGVLERQYNGWQNYNEWDLRDKIYIGSYNGNSDYFHGDIDEIRLYDKALSSQEISVLYDNSSLQKSNVSIQIATGSTSGSVELKGTDDVTQEADETIIAKIISTTAATETGDQKVTILLTDNDSTSVDISVTSDPIDEGYLRYATVTATLDKVSELPVTVNLNSSGVDSTDFYLSISSDTTAAVATLSAHYTFSGDASDISGNKNDGTISGATLVKDRFGNDNSAMFFDGDNDYVEIPISKSLQIEDEITMNLWINVEKSGGSDFIIFADGDYYSLEVDGSSYNDGIYGDTAEWTWGAKSAGFGYQQGLSFFNGNRPAQQRWYMITYTLTKEIDENDGEIFRFRGYYNGQLIDSGRSYNNWNRSVPQLGSKLFLGMSGPTPNHHFKGTLDDVRIYKGALTPDQVGKLYEKEKLGLGDVDVNSITVDAGSLSSSVYVYASDDGEFNEGTETLTLTQGNISNGYSGSSKSVDITIRDNDIKPTVSLSKVSGDQLQEGSNKYITIDAKIDSVTTRDIQISVLPNSESDASKEDIRVTLDNDTTNSSSITKLVLHYTFDGDASDQTNYNHDGTVTGATLVEDRFGNANSAYSFGGEPVDHIKTPMTDELKIKDRITMSFWAKLPSDEEFGKQRAVITGPESDGVYQLSLQRRNDEGQVNPWQFGARGQLINQETWVDVSLYNDWNHFVFVQEPDSAEQNTINRIYYNGILITESNIGRGPRSYTNDQGNNLIIGAYRGNEPWNAFRGILDDVRIYQGAMSGDEVKALFDKESEDSKSVDLVNKIIIPAGSKSQRFYLFAEDDEVFNEPKEELSLTIDSVINGKLGSFSPINTTIIENDIKPTVGISSINNSLREGSNSYSTIEAKLDSVTTFDVTVYLEKSGDASEDDYILSQSNDTTKISSSSLAAHLPFDGNADDISGNANNGEVVGAILTTDRFGNENSAYYFDGSNDYILVKTPIFSSDDRKNTVNIWVNHQGSRGGEIFNDNNQLKFTYYYDESPNGIGLTGYSSGSYNGSDLNGALTNDNWYMVTFVSFPNEDTENSGSMEMVHEWYVNGNFINRTASYYDPDGSFNLENKLWIGIGDGRSNNNPFKGKLDDIRFYRGALDAEEISKIYSKESTSMISGDVITVPAGSLSSKVYVFVNDDNIFDEKDETLTFAIDSTDYAFVSSNSNSVSITLSENDVRPEVTLSIEGDTLSENNTDQFSTIKATLSEVTTRDVIALINDGEVGELDFEIKDDTTKFSAVGLAAHYTFDGSVEDISGNNHTGVANGTAFIQDRFGNENSALYFNGNDDNIRIPFTGSLKIEKDITLSAWVYVGSKGDKWQRQILNVEGNNSNHHYEIYINTWDNNSNNQERNQFRVGFRSGGFGYESNIDCINGECANRPKRERWYMLSYTFGKETIAGDSISGDLEVYKSYTYLDGNLIEERVVENYWNNSLPESGTLVIGNQFYGILDDIRIYDGVLSSEKIMELYDRESTGGGFENSITVPAGSLSSLAYIYPLDDEIYESYELKSLSVDSAINGKVNSATVSLVIEDNDNAPEVSISSDKEYLGEIDGFNISTITATLTNAVSDTVKVPLVVTGDADSLDFNISNSFITINPGDVEGSVSVTALSDSIIETNEKLIIRAVDVKNASDTVKQVISLLITEDVCDFIETDIKGNVFEDLTLYNICKPYIILGDLIVANNATLTIEPGVEIEFDGPYSIEVIDGGKIISRGTEEDSITISGIAWGGIDIRTPGSEIQYTKIIEEGNSSNEDYMLKLVGSHIDKSHVYGGRNGIYLEDSSTVSRSKIHSMRNHAISLHSKSVAYANTIYDVGTDMSWSPTVMSHSNSYVINNNIFSTLSDPNMIAVGAQYGSVISGNTIGSENGVHGRFGLLINNSSDIVIEDNRIGGFKTNVVLIGTRPEFKSNTFMGELDAEDKYMNVRVASGQLTQENQNYPQYLSQNSYGGSGYGVDRQVIDMQGNYWDNVNSEELPSFIYDYDDRGDLIGDVDFSNALTKPSSDAPIAPPKNVIKLVNSEGVEFKWSPNEEEDLAGYKVYFGRNENGTFESSIDVGNETSYVLVGGNINNDYYLTAYDTDADGSEDQFEGHESRFANPAASVEVSIVTDNNNISELEQFNSTVVSVILSSTSPEDITVDLEASGQADLGTDFELSSSSVTIKSGTLSTDVTVTAISDDNDNEEDELVEISVSESSSVTLGRNSSVVINIASDICEFIPTSISGPIEEDLTLYNLCNPYYVTGNLFVREGVTLTIEPGVTVVFSSGTYMSVNGKLVAEGTEEDSITFTGNRWNDINIQGSSRGSSLKYVRITDRSGNDYEWKLKLRNATISNSEIFNVQNAILLQDSASIEYSTIRDVRGRAVEASSGSTIYGNNIYDIFNTGSGGNSAVSIREYSVFRNNIIREINGGNAALEVGQNSIARENIIGGYSGNQGHVGILIREGADHTIRNNKVGGFTANVVLIGTKPTFSRNSFIGNLNKSGSGQFNVVVGNNNVNINDSVRYDIGFWGWGYNGDPETISMRNNYWGISDNEIEKSIFDYDDENERRGDINFDNGLTVPDDDTPLTPPAGLVITETSLNNYSLTWSSNTEEDISGYNLYTGINLENKVDLGNANETTVEIPDVNKFNIGLTAYDNEADGVNDMVEGNESLPTTDYTLNTLPRAVDDTLRVPINSSITLDQYPESGAISISFEFGNNLESEDGSFNAVPSTTTNDNWVLAPVEVDFVEDRFGISNAAVNLSNENFLVVDGTQDSSFIDVDKDFAISLWFRLDSNSLNNKAVLISKSFRDDNNDYVWELSHTPWSGIEFNYNNEYQSNGIRIYDTDWHHLTLTYQKNPVNGFRKLYMYLDGIKVVESDRDFNSTQFNNPLFIGSRYGYPWESLRGSVDDIVMYDRALAEEQVQALYNFSASQNILYNDIDLDGDILSAKVVEDVSHGTLTLDSNGDIVTYTPDTDFSGYDQFTYRANDGTYDSEIANVLISVSTPPTGNDDDYIINEDSTLIVDIENGLLANDEDAESDPLEVVLVIDEKYHSSYDFTNWRLPYEPDNYDNGDFASVNSDGFWEDQGYNVRKRYIIEFNDLRTSVSGSSNYYYLGKWNGHSYFISDNTYNWENANLIAEEDGGYLFIPNSYAENQYVNNISFNSDYWIGFYQDKDAEDYEEPSSGWRWVEDGIVATGTEINGDITVNKDGSFIYVPNPNFFGENVFKYFAFDGIQYSDTTEVKITVNAVDDPPVAVRDYYTILEDDTLEAVSGFSLSAPETGMVVYYPFDGNINDYGPNGVELSVYGNPKPTNDRFGNLNSAFYFDGERDFMLGDASIFPTDNQSFSVSLWFKSDDIGRNNGFARQLFGYGGPSFNLSFDNPALPSSNSFEVSGQYAQGSSYRFRTKYAYDRNSINDKWHNVIITYTSSEASDTTSTDSLSSSGMMNIYFDGERVLSNELGEVNNKTFDKVFTIGANPNQNGDYVYIYPSYKWFKGSIDDLIMYNRVLSQDEIKSLSSTSFATVLANDLEVDGESLSATLVDEPSNGQVTLFNNNGIFVYVPESNYNGTDEMYYVASDGNSTSDTTLIKITIIEVDDPPLGTGDTLHVDEDDILVLNSTNGVLSNDVDVDGDELSSELVRDVTKGILDFYGDGSLTYIPDTNFYGEDSFNYVAKDETNITDSIRVLIIVDPVNDVPTASDDEYVLEAGDSLVIDVDSLGLLANDIDIDGDTLSAALIDSVSHGTIIVNSDGTFKYVTSESDFTGIDTFTYSASDTASSDTASVKITVTSRPVAVADTFELNEDYCLLAGDFGAPTYPNSNVIYQLVAGGVLDNDTDVDGDSIFAVLVETTSFGSLSFFSDGRFEYCPEADFNGTDSFTYIISDGYLISDTVTVTITVLPANDMPIGKDDVYGLVKNSTLVVLDSLGILSNDYDVDGDSIFSTLLDSTKYGSIELGDGGGFTYIPDQDYLGADGFKYNLSDGLFITDTVNVTLIITSRPVANDDSYSIGEDSSLVVLSGLGVLSNDEDEDSEDLSAQVIQSTAEGELLFSSDGSFEYNPNKDFFGSDLFTYYVSDGILSSDTATVSITINPGNDNPEGVSDEYSVDEGGTISVVSGDGVLSNDIDIDSDSLYSVLDASTSFGELTFNSDGSFEYIHDGSNSSLDEFTYFVFDTLGGVDTVTSFISINPVNDEPVISAGQVFSIFENSAEGTQVGRISVLDENIQTDLSGTFDITTDNLWCIEGDTSTNKSFTGKVEIEEATGNSGYTVNIITDGGLRLNDDFSFGGYYTCFNGFDGTPSGSLRLVVEDNTLKIEGVSQWGESYDISGLTMEGASLTIEWSNSIGEHGVSTITRDDDVNWVDLISNSGNNVGFDWDIISGNEDEAFTVDNIGNIRVNNSATLDYEIESLRSRSLTVTANDGTFTSAQESITINVENVWDMSISSILQDDAYCEGFAGSITIEVTGNEGEVTANWTNGSSGLSIDNLLPGFYEVNISDSVGSISKTFEINELPIYSGVDICYVTADSIDITKNRIFINEGQDPYNIDKFLIYREGSVANQYDLIGEIDTDSGEGSFLDQDIDNRQRAFRYKVAILDNCGNVSPLNDIEHVSNHLQASQGINGEINLEWTGYEGNLFIPTYQIYKQVNEGDYELLEEVSSNTLSYTDLNVDPANSYKYFIGFEADVNCISEGGGINIRYDEGIDLDFDKVQTMIQGGASFNDPVFASYIDNKTGLKGKKVIRSSPFSLDAEPQVLSVEPIIVEAVNKVYPNPASQILYVDLADNAGDIEKLYFVDFSGKVIDNIRFIQKGDKAAVDTNSLQSGIYLMDITTKLGHSRVKVVIQK